jgi:hypothetical protein
MAHFLPTAADPNPLYRTPDFEAVADRNARLAAQVLSDRSRNRFQFGETNCGQRADRQRPVHRD